jgi:hypothetical protein
MDRQGLANRYSAPCRQSFLDPLLVQPLAEHRFGERDRSSTRTTMAERPFAEGTALRKGDAYRRQTLGNTNLIRPAHAPGRLAHDKMARAGKTSNPGDADNWIAARRGSISLG